MLAPGGGGEQLYCVPGIDDVCTWRGRRTTLHSTVSQVYIDGVGNLAEEENNSTVPQV